MRKMFSTDDFRVSERFRLWREATRERLPPFEMWSLGGNPFEGRWEAAKIGGLDISRTAFSPHQVEHTRCSAHHGDAQDKLPCIIRLAGTSHSCQHDRTTVQRPGDITVFDRAAAVSHSYDTPMQTLRIELPRDRLERVLGPARIFAALPVNGDLPSAALARTFFAELVRVHEGMAPDSAERMTTIGVDLLVASITERMALETPRPIQGTVTVQRAKAYVEAHLGDPTLDPPKLAAAVGVSLRRLQELFHAHGRHIADWIWERRLAAAAQGLADPGRAHLSIGALSYGCGFANQGHFSKRFRGRFGVSPREYRRGALVAGS